MIIVNCRSYHFTTIHQFIHILAITIVISISGCVTSPQAPSSRAAEVSSQVPSLKVLIDCGSCQVRVNIPDLIVEGYKEAASEDDAQVVAELEATATIKEYSDRSDGARLFAGAFAGKDDIRADVTYKERKFTVRDYYRNAWLGIEVLAKKIGGMIYAEMKE